MNKVYLLQHLNHHKNGYFNAEYIGIYSEIGYEDVKNIGLYTSIETLQKNINRCKKLPGFKQLADCFFSAEYQIDQSFWNEGFELDSDIPLWAKDKTLQSNETSEEFAHRLCSQKYGENNYPTSLQDEFHKIKGYRDYLCKKSIV